MKSRLLAMAAIVMALASPTIAHATGLQVDGVTSQSRTLFETMTDADDIQRRQEISDMCEVLGLDARDYYVGDVAANWEYVGFLYQERYEKPTKSASSIWSELAGDLRPYVVSEEDAALVDEGDATPATAAEAQARLERLAAIRDAAVAERERQEEEERAREAAAAKAAAARSAATTTSYSGPSSGLTKSSGVNYYNGTRETYYSSRVLYHYRTSEWTVDSEGFYRDSAGRYVVASSDHPLGTVITTSKGESIVLDSGCASGTRDFYVSW